MKATTWALAAIATLAAPCAAQLDLTPQAPLPPIGSPHPTDATLSTLDVELARLRLARTVATERRLELVDAFIATRVLAASLLGFARRADGELVRPSPEQATAAALGFRLAEARAPIDAVLRGALDRSDDGDRPIGELLRRFAASSAPAAEALDRASGERELRAATAQAILPLAAAVSALARAPIANAWPIAVGDGSLAIVTPPPELPALRARIESLKLADDGRAALTECVQERATAGDAFGRRRDGQRRAAAAALIDLLEASSAAEFLNDSQRSMFEQRATRIAADLVDDAKVAEAVGRAAESGESARVLAALTAVREELGEQFRLIAPLAALLDRIDEQVDPDATPPPRAAKRAIVAALERIAAQRSLEVEVRGPELVEAKRALLVQYRQTEASLLRSLGRLAESMGIDSDPDLVSLLREHRQLVDDLKRLDELQEWSRRVAQSSPTRADAVRAQLGKMMRWLVDPNRRPDAAQAIAQIERQAELFAALPAEDCLRRGELDGWLAADASKGLADAIAAARTAWADAWARGDGGGAAVTRMVALLRTMRLVDAVEAFAPGGGAPRRATLDATLERWAGWSVPMAAVEAVAEAEADALRALVGTIAAGGPRDADLKSLERRLALPRLAIVSADRVGPALASAPRGAIAPLSAVTEPPLADAWPRGAVDELAMLGLYARAWKAAADAENHAEKGDDADELRTAVDAIADRILRDLGEWRGPVPTLREWDGSDPDARK